MQVFLEKLVRGCGEKPYRARQVCEWIFGKRVRDFERMTTLPAGLRSLLKDRLGLGGLSCVTTHESSDGTRKYLWSLRDGSRIESVRIPARGRETLCLSSQVGCPLACRFCATGYMGLKRDLTPGEMVEQAIGMLGERRAGEAVNVVFMGMGEPMLNLPAVLGAVSLLNGPRGLGIGARRITISTAGLPDGIRELARLPLQVRLAVSLHAARDVVRSALMPINRRYPLAVLLESCREYWRLRRRRIYFEYVLIPGVNDGEEDLAALRELLGGLPSKVNLLPYNEITQAGYRRPTGEELHRFEGKLGERLLQTVSVREPRGDDVAGACGQLWVSHPGIRSG